MKINLTLQQALKYSTETADLMVKALEREIGQGSDAIHNHHNATRLVTADALDDAGREQEAKWLREQGPFRLSEGKVIPQRYIRPDRHLHHYPTFHIINRISDWQVDPNFMPAFFRLDTRESGDHPADNETVFSEHDFPVHGMLGEHPYNPEEGMHTLNPVETFHVKDYGKRKADHFRRVVEPYRDQAEIQDLEELEQRLQTLEKAPYTEDLVPGATHRLYQTGSEP